MIEYTDHSEPETGKHDTHNPASESASRKSRSTMSKSMHDGVEVWCDCCSCEAEPYWIEAMKDFDTQE